MEEIEDNKTLDRKPPFSDPNVGSESGKPGRNSNLRGGEVDTSAPFESVKEAVSRFGGIGFWKPHTHKPSEDCFDVFDVARVEEQATQLEKDLILKERETLEVLKELEATKTSVEELKLKLQKEEAASEVTAALNPGSDDSENSHPPTVEAEEKKANESEVPNSTGGGLSLCPSSAPGFILMELKQAKLNLTRTTNDLADIRATVETFNKKIEKERTSLEKTRQRLSSNSSKVLSLEQEVNQTNQKLQIIKNVESQNPVDISREIQRLTSEMEEFKKTGEAAKAEVSRAMSEIKLMKMRMKTTEARLIAARKMKEAAKASEALALSEMKALSHSTEKKTSSGTVTLSFQEYTSLTSRAQEAEEASQNRVNEAMVKVDDANVSTAEILQRVEEATEEVKTSKRALEEALNRVEAANSGKLAVEEALRKWRSENGQKRRSSIHNSTKFKNSSYQPHLRSNSRLFDVNGRHLLGDGSVPVLKPTLSIGQILSRKLLLNEEYEKSSMKKNVSLGQMLRKHNGDVQKGRKDERESGQNQIPAKRKKFGFARISFLVAKPSKKKKKHAAGSSRLFCAPINN